jgi:hypothetical protein
MNSNTPPRRKFIQQMGLITSAVALSPQVLWANTPHKLSIAGHGESALGLDWLKALVTNHPDLLAKISDATQTADVLYVSQNLTQKLLNQALSQEQYLIVERQALGEISEKTLIDTCQQGNILLAIVERNKEDNKPFSRTAFYEANLSKGIAYQRHIKFLNLLAAFTQNTKLTTVHYSITI